MASFNASNVNFLIEVESDPEDKITPVNVAPTPRININLLQEQMHELFDEVEEGELILPDEAPQVWTPPNLKSMVMAFRVTELQALLAFAGKNKTGRKNELQARALELVKLKSPPIVMKIRELYRSIQISNYSQPLNPSTLSTRAGSSSYSTASAYAADLKLETGNTTSFARNVGYTKVVGVDGQFRNVPICPDVKMKELPFYDILATLLRPTSLLNQGQSPKQEAQHSFCLSPSQAAEITSSREVIQNEAGSYLPTKIQYLVQVQLRFCALDTTADQDDLFPQGLQVKVNGRLVQLPSPIPSNRPGVEPKRPSKALNVTTNVKCCPLSTNTIHVSWLADPQRNYCMQITMVKKLTAQELFARLKQKRIQPADFTRGRIKEITTAEEEDLCAPTSIRVSVACPLGKSRMTYPCRATTCKHLQCFDANLFLLMNEKKPTFMCPVCNKQLKFGDLCIDGYFMDVIKNLSIDAGNEIELFADGSWLPAIKVKSEAEEIAPPAKRMKVSAPEANKTIDLEDEIAILSDEEEDRKPVVQPPPPVASAAAGRSSPEVIDLLSSDEEEEEEAEPARVPSPVVQAPPPPQVVQQDDEESEEEIGIRPRRRRNQKVSYVEESSDSSTTNEGDSSSAPVPQQRRARSPACIELSDSPSPEPRPFAGVGTGGGSSSNQQTHQQPSSSGSGSNSRSGSGSSSNFTTQSTSQTASLYSAARMTGTGTGTPSLAAGTTATGNPPPAHAPHHYPLPPYHHHHPYVSSSASSITTSTPSYQLHQVSRSSSSVSSSPAAVPTTAAAFFPAGLSVAGYTASRGVIPSWEEDLSTFMSSHHSSSLSYEPSASFNFDDLFNMASVHPFSTSSSTSTSSGGGGGTGSHGGSSTSGYAGGWL